MPDFITAEFVFDKHVAANSLPKRSDDETLDGYVERVGADLDELKRRLAQAVAAARVAEHSDCAFWCAQARQELPRKR